MWQLLTYLFYNDSISNKETFMEATIIHSLQGFHNYYGMYVVVRRLRIILLFFFPYFISFPSTLRRLKEGN